MLYLLPDELLVAVAEYCDQRTRMSLSLVSRRLRDPSQRIIYEVIQKTLPSWWDCDDLQTRRRRLEFISNDRLISYINTLNIYKMRALYFRELEVDHPELELLFTTLLRMHSLRDIRLEYARVTTTMLDQLCKLLSTQFLNLNLVSCSYPINYIIQQNALKVNKLEWGDEEELPATIELLTAFIERSSSTITSLALFSDFDGLANFGRLPRLTSFILIWESIDGEGLREFLVANPQLEYLELQGAVPNLSRLPSSALPNLTRVCAPAYMMDDIVPGRPVKNVRFHELFQWRTMRDGVRSLSRSTAPIIELTMELGHCVRPLILIVNAVVDVMPHLERVQFSCHAIVSDILPRRRLTLIDHPLSAFTNRPGSSCQPGLTA